MMKYIKSFNESHEVNMSDIIEGLGYQYIIYKKDNILNIITYDSTNNGTEAIKRIILNSKDESNNIQVIYYGTDYEKATRMKKMQG